jgi:hypothetical protein
MLRRRVNVSRWITVYADLFDEDLDDVAANLDAAIRSAGTDCGPDHRKQCR